MGSLEEYLNDPNFEQNRIEYKANKDAADRDLKNTRTVAKKVEKCKHLNSDHLRVLYSHGTACISAIYPSASDSRGILFKGNAKGRNAKGFDGLLPSD